jgi:hypothetical protein
MDPSASFYRRNVDPAKIGKLKQILDAIALGGAVMAGGAVSAGPDRRSRGAGLQIHRQARRVDRRYS